MKFTAYQIAEILGGDVEGNENVEVFKLAKIEEGDNHFRKRSKGRHGKHGRHGRHGSHSKEHGSPKNWSGCKKEKMMKMKGFFDQMVTKLVD